MKRLITLALCVLALAACTTNKPLPVPITDAGTGQTNKPPERTPEVVPLKAEELPSEGPRNGEYSQRSIYFDLDSYVVKDEFRHVVELHARYVKEHPVYKIVLEGNADERGSSEYNLALGQKRAEAVKSMMRTLGVPEGQLEAVSFGKERPQDPGHDEAAWAKNRRADIRYQRIP